MAEMLKAIRSNDVRKVSKKLQKGYDVNKPINETSHTVQGKKQVSTIPICLAATHGLREIVELLLSYGANIHACNIDWSTPLHMATFHGHMEIIRCLVERRVNLNNSDQQGNTALHLAVIKNNYEAASLYVENNIDVDIRNNKGETALDIARALQYEHYVNLIEDKKRSEREQAYNKDEKRVQAKRVMSEITKRESLHRRMAEMKIQEVENALNDKESELRDVTDELKDLDETATMLTRQITQLEAKLRDVNQERVTKEKIKNNILEDMEELRKRKEQNNNEGETSSVTRSHSLKERSEYECPICFELPFAPKKVYQCANGHVYCSECKEKPNMTHCPQCRVPLDQNSAIRNIVYEDMISKKQQRRATTQL